MKNNIVLIGFMGSGKTSVGDCLANKLSFGFVDTDQMIEEKNQMAITKIFAEQGEEYFRDLETNTIKDMLQNFESCVISTGGGLPLREVNSDILKELGYVVYLKVSRDTVLARLKGDHSRPLLAGENASEKVDTMIKYRDPIYEKAADAIVIVDNKPIYTIMNEIMGGFAAYQFDFDK